MKVVAITDKCQAELVERSEPRVKADFAVVKIHVAPMCTEYKDYQGGSLRHNIGHEAAGEVVEVAKPGRVKLGDRVVVMPLYPCGKCELCMTGDYIHCEHNVNPLEICGSETGTATFAQYCIKQDWLLIPIPDDISYEHASMACCGLGPSFGAMQHMKVDAFDTVLIVGLGPVGLGGVINGIYRGARVIGVDPNPYRRKLALALGASTVINPNDPGALDQIKALTGGRGVDKSIDCTAIPTAQQFAIQATRRRGHVTFVGWGGHIEMGNMVPQGLTLQGSWHWNLRDAYRILQVIHSCGDLIDQLITHTFPMKNVQEAWDLQLTGNCGKVLLKPWEF
jgi:L-iditol 2-dehydrogenase